MDFYLNDEQKAVQEMARRFADEELAPRAERIDETGEFDLEAYRKMGELGLLTMTLPEEFGGAAADTLTWCLVVEELSRACTPLANTLVMAKMTSDLILTFGTEDQKKTVLPRMATGESICAFGLTEPDAGSDAGSVRTTARQDGKEYVLNGQKMFISGAEVADWIIVAATMDKSLGSKGMCAFLVPRNAAGCDVGKRLKLMGVRGEGTCPVYLDQCRVPEDHLLTAGGFRAIMQTLDAARAGIAAMATGIAQAAFDAAKEYARERKQFGKPLTEFQAVQFLLADMSMNIDAARTLTYKAAWRRDQGLPYIKDASHAKLFASEMCARCTDDALQIHGGYGYTKDYPVERYFRDARIHTIWEGTSQIQRIIISRQLAREA